MRKNIYKLPHSKSTYRLNFLYIVVWLSGHGVEATYLTASSEQPTHSSVDWAQQPWLAASQEKDNSKSKPMSARCAGQL